MKIKLLRASTTAKEVEFAATMPPLDIQRLSVDLMFENFERNETHLWPREDDTRGARHEIQVIADDGTLLRTFDIRDITKESGLKFLGRRQRGNDRRQKSTDPGLSAAERKEARSREAREAIADHEEAQRTFNENRERLRAERIARESSAGPMYYPAPELPDDTPIDKVRFATRIRKAVTAAGWTTVGEIREASDTTLLSLQDLGQGSVAHLRETLGLPSKDGVRPDGRKAKK
jgi:hypothetical protein